MARVRVDWSATARRDLEAIVRYIAQDSIDQALAVLDRLESRATALAIHPERGRVVPELRALGVLQYHEIIERPWRILYRVQGARVLVLAVLDGRRSLANLLLERFVRS